MAVSTPSGSNPFEGFTPAQLQALVAASPLYQVLGAGQTQQLDGARLVDVLEFSFAVTNRPGIFTARMPITGALVAAAGLAYVPGGFGGGNPAAYAGVGTGIDLTPFAERVESIYEIEV